MIKTVQNVSHLMPVRDQGNFLQGACKAILQNYEKGDDVLIVDDSFAGLNSNFVREQFPPNVNLQVLETRGKGLVEALNTGVANAQNDWIARYDVDDKYSSRRLALQRLVLRENVSVVFSDYRFHFPSGAYAGFVPSPVFPVATKISLFLSQQTAHPVAVINKWHLIEVGGYRSNDFPAEDLGVWLRISRLGNLLSVPRTLLNYRLSKDSTSGSRRKQISIKHFQLLREVGLSEQALKSELKDIRNSFFDYEMMNACNLRRFMLLRALSRAAEFGLHFLSPSELDLPTPSLWRALWNPALIAAGSMKIIRDLYRS